MPFPLLPVTMCIVEDAARRVGRQLALIRGRLGLSQSELAQRAGLDKKTIYNIEVRGLWPRPLTQARVEQALDLREGELARMLARAEIGAELEVTDPIRDLVEVSDDELLTELAYRLQTYRHALNPPKANTTPTYSDIYPVSGRIAARAEDDDPLGESE